MNPIFATTCAIASAIFEIAQSLSQDPARKTSGVFFVPEGASTLIRGLLCEACERPDEEIEIPDPDAADAPWWWTTFTLGSDRYSKAVEQIARRLRINHNAIFEIGGFDNFNQRDQEALLACLAQGQIGPVFSSEKVSLVDATFIVRTSFGFPGKAPSFAAFLDRFKITPDIARNLHFHGVTG